MAKTRQRRESALDAGRLARVNGLPKTANPHKNNGKSLYPVWLAGWKEEDNKGETNVNKN